LTSKGTAALQGCYLGWKRFVWPQSIVTCDDDGFINPLILATELCFTVIFKNYQGKPPRCKQQLNINIKKQLLYSSQNTINKDK
jgi:hypothetical protein